MNHLVDKDWIKEVIQFANNVEFVCKARELLEAPEGYAYSYSSEDGICRYRMLDDEGKERRCIIGRMLYGHIPEDHPLWDRSADIVSIVVDYPDIKSKFPWLSTRVIRKVQQVHDQDASACSLLYRQYDWTDLEELAANCDLDVLEKSKNYGNNSVC